MAALRSRPHSGAMPLGQADLDLGNYERFVDVRLTRDHNITTGKIYQARARHALRTCSDGGTCHAVSAALACRAY